MLEIVTVRFDIRKATAQFLAQGAGLRVGDRCVVTTEQGVELGMVLSGGSADQSSFEQLKLHKALRKATERDLYLNAKKEDREAFAYRLCRKQLKIRKLPMKLSCVEYLFDGSRAIFYFTADRRVDFRQLVKDLARQLRTRIEMRQIGARDEAKLVGCMGCCGLGENCSSAFLKKLRSVSVRTAKAQDLGMNPNRLSGMCGRLKCCLNYEASASTKSKRGGCGRKS